MMNMNFSPLRDFKKVLGSKRVPSGAVTLKINIMKLVNKKVRIISDNENYTEWVNIDLRITHASNKGLGYDDSCYPEKLCDLEDCETGESCPFALYEYEFELIEPLHRL